MMNEDIMAELYFLLHSFGMGVLIMILYDVLRIFRKLVAHSVFALALEDLIYWLMCGICIFLMLYKENFVVKLLLCLKKLDSILLMPK